MRSGSHYGTYVRNCNRWRKTAALLLCLQASLFAGAVNEATAKLRTGKDIFQAGCIACHGKDGKGTPQAIAGFKPPRTFPDFTQCDQTTPERNTDWKAVIREGGPFRGFSQIMPSFGEALTSQQIDMVVDYLRSFCGNPVYPRGELNLPRALVTEKAFPEKEVVVTTSVNAHGAPGVTNQILHEQRVGIKDQVEIGTPVNFTHPDHTWFGGIGDVTLGWKHVLVSSLAKGSIMSVQGEVLLPTGSRSKGFGTGTTVFETFATYGQLLPGRTFLQMQGGGEFPTDTAVAPKAAYWRTTLGKSFQQSGGLGRMWSPMVEFLADREFESGAKTNWDILPEMQVTLSRRQHMRANFGVRIPANNTAGRPVQLMLYLLWDWQDGRLNEGWR